ncbi:TMAO reductase system periplasmic protein TorT [Candidatus Puniceispirillum marinum]|uniref:ABC transporter, substrate binding protein n=1 Tax=Puniceispirillum marinum (strain IMCC1322) TaxID=488538 RepID=D5BMG9_PUNMI|nr:TMAO reductase system periplasmic protein TorT [Candidatus Puniceispirillum marinum]ADE40012.1 Putative ABC transporter, substrate binding protein [Candidatus Puniceispirillum marinum IMCC1322]
MKKTMFGLMASCAVLIGATALADTKWFPYPVQVWKPAFNMDSPRTDLDYVALSKAATAHELCVSFPHMKDAYWLGVNYGVTEEAKRLGVKMQVVEAGGYTELNNQISQIEDCVAAGADAVIIGAISFDGMNNLVKEISKKGIPVIDVINGMSAPELTAKSLVSFGEMGAKTGAYLAELHPAGTATVEVAWFPGPAGAGWVEAGNSGFADAIKGSAINLVATKYGDTGKEAQAKLVEDTLAAFPDLDYIVGTAVTAEAAIPILRSQGLADDIKIAAYYFTPGVYQGIKRRQILAAPTDSTVIQGRIAVDIAVRALEGRSFEKHVGPELYVVSQDNIKSFDPTSTLAPAGFKPIFRVD